MGTKAVPGFQLGEMLNKYFKVTNRQTEKTCRQTDKQAMGDEITDWLKYKEKVCIVTKPQFFHKKTTFNSKLFK